MSDDSKAPQSSKHKLQLAILVVLIPLAIYGGLRTYGIYSRVLESERLFTLAHQKMDAKEWQPALQYLDQCLKVNPIYFPAYEAQAAIYADEMKDEKAVTEVLDTAVAKCKDDPRAQQLYGFYLLHYFKDYKRAQEHLRAAARALPNDPALRNMLRAADDKAAGKGLPAPGASPGSLAPSGQPGATTKSAPPGGQPVAPGGSPAAAGSALPSGQPMAPSGRPAATEHPPTPSGQPSKVTPAASPG